MGIDLDLLSTHEPKESKSRKAFRQTLEDRQLQRGWYLRHLDKPPEHGFKKGTKFGLLVEQGWEACNRFLNQGKVPDYDEELMDLTTPASPVSIREIVEG